MNASRILLVSYMLLQANKVASLSVFMRTTWLSNVTGDFEPHNWRQWFELVARGRAEGPTSPYYVEELALQNTACCESHPVGSYKALGCLGPKCSDLGLPPNTLLTAELDEMSAYFHLFDRVYIGTTTWQDWRRGNATSTAEYAQRQAKIGRQFLERYGHLENDGRVKFAWYLTDEGSLPYIGINPVENQYIGQYLSLSMESLYAVKPMEFLWSPSNGDFTPNATQRQSELNGLKHLLCGLPHPLGLHFQDFLGQSVSFEFPFFYNYTEAFTCERDTVPTYNMLKQVQKFCPDKLRDVKVNAELFAERLATGTHSHGEDNGANIINADPREVASRLACYARHKLEVGCSWAMNHWHSIWTFANATVYKPY